MCVAVPAQILWIGDGSPLSVPALVDAGGHELAVDIAMVPEAVIGDYVITHSGYAIRILAAAEAAELRAQLGR